MHPLYLFFQKALQEELPEILYKSEDQDTHNDRVFSGHISETGCVKYPYVFT